MAPIEVQIHPDDESVYRILDGAHRFTAYKGIGATVIDVRIIALDGVGPLLSCVDFTYVHIHDKIIHHNLGSRKIGNHWLSRNIQIRDGASVKCLR